MGTIDLPTTRAGGGEPNGVAAEAPTEIIFAAHINAPHVPPPLWGLLLRAFTGASPSAFDSQLPRRTCWYEARSSRAHDSRTKSRPAMIVLGEFQAPFLQPWLAAALNSSYRSHSATQD